VPALRTIASETLAALAHVRARVSRNTINIGVSGRARMGKSTLLQSLSGLGDNQIPSGEGPPVTAVRSRIFHSLTQSRAVLITHTEASFCTQVLAAYHEELGLPSSPGTLAEFADYRYPASVADLGSDTAKRLREMQESLPHYRRYLTGERREVKLSELRAWVAYPAEDRTGAVPERLYLAVKEALITCPFPLDEAIDLALVDLPGLGEVVAGAEERHLEGLVNDVDFVIMVKRPRTASA
jgi:energy-coupling factor transporter ATP-binding protein EcfA2